MDLLAWSLAAGLHLSQGRDVTAVVTAIHNRAVQEAPLFPNDANKKKTMAFALAVAFREGSLREHIQGDKVGSKFTSFCTFQVNLPNEAKTQEGWTGEEVDADINKCVTVGFRMLRTSIAKCPKFPVAFYARGPRWESKEAQNISTDRQNLTNWLLANIKEPDRS